jgi:CO/xanthine dehydrogenase FAD-binding subunit
MRMWNSYTQPASVEQALQALDDAQGHAAIIAGGTDLLLDIDQGRRPAPELLIDVTCIDEMSEVRLEEDYIYLGAAVTHKAITANPILMEHAACLVEGCALIGGPQVRNVATIGGNVAHALPAGDGTIGLLALDAQALLASVKGRTWKPLAELFAGPGETTFNRSQEILLGFKLPLREPNEHSAFHRIMRPQGVAIAILNMAVWVKLAPAGTLESVRIAVGPGGPVPFRAHATETFLAGRTPDSEAMVQATETLLDEIHLRTSKHRASLAYRQHLTGILLERTLGAALSKQA